MEEEEEEEKKAECNSAGEESRVPQCLGISNERLVVIMLLLALWDFADCHIEAILIPGYRC